MTDIKPKCWQIAVLAGDGIGPEVMAEGLKVLAAVQRRVEGIQFDIHEYSAGAEEYLRSGQALPEAVFEACRQADAILLGAMGLPHVRGPDGRELAPQLDLRERLDLFCGLRPLRLFHANDTPLKRVTPETIDLLIVRENTEGLFSTRQIPIQPKADEASDTLKITRRGAERLFRVAFSQARRRRKHLTLVDKANVLPSMVFFRQIFDEVAAEFPDVHTERVYVDAAALYLVRQPERFDVLVTENMFGDILSDLGAALVGGMGMAPSADVGMQHAVFQPAHGSAPDIAGRGVANPVATILSMAMMLDWLGPQTAPGADLVRQAVARVLADPEARTPDLGGRLSTTQLGDLIAEQVQGAMVSGLAHAAGS